MVRYSLLSRSLFAATLAVAALASLRIDAATIYVGNYGNQLDSGSIGTYNSDTGAAINANFITGLSWPGALQVSGNNLYVLDYNLNTVSSYNATTGALQNNNVIGVLDTPFDFKISGNTIYTLENGNTEVRVTRFNATTGLMDGSFVIQGDDGLAPSVFNDGAYNITLANGLIYLVDEGDMDWGNFPPTDLVPNDGKVRVFDAATGSHVTDFSIGGNPFDLQVDGSNLYVYDYVTGIISLYNALTGAALNPSLVTGITDAQDILVFDGKIYVPSLGDGSVDVYDSLTGTLIANNFFSGLNGPGAFAVPEPSRALLLLAGLGLITTRRRR